jgi:hypothetical protein
VLAPGSQPCWMLHKRCSGAYLRLPEGIELTQPRELWTSLLQEVHLSHRQVQRPDGQTYAEFTERVGWWGQGAVLDKGCI